MNPVEIIRKKRNGEELSENEILSFITEYVHGDIPDYQMSALLMAIYFRGLSYNEIRSLTKAYINSGKRIDLSFMKKPKIDKHSTGGVGDKTSLILAPLVSCFDVIVPMISGRGLGHTGGTLDKLESIPGFKVNLSVDEFITNLEIIGVCMIGQTSYLTPADKKIYALRDVTATVDNTGLITASITSKKIAEGAEGIVYDIKRGSGANLSEDKINELVRYLLNTSKEFGQKALAVITDMNSPIGYTVGNWLEVKECIEIMNPSLPVSPNSRDLLELTLFLSGAMLYLAEISSSIEEGIKLSGEKLINGDSFRKFCEIVKLQGGDLTYINELSKYPKPAFEMPILSETDGYLAKTDALAFGKASVELGCGRKKTNDTIDYSAGIILEKKPGDMIKKGEIICRLYAQSEERLSIASEIISKGIIVSESYEKPQSMIIDVIEA